MPAGGAAQGDADRLARLEAQVAAILRRLEMLSPQAQLSPEPPPHTPRPHALTEPTAPAEPRAELEPAATASASVSAADQSPIHGTLLISGAPQRGEQRFMIRYRADIAESLATDTAVAARVFAALGSPFRVHVLRALLERSRTSQQLQELLAVGPVGQLYHHLKELIAAGLIFQQKRGVYAVRQELIIPLALAFVALRLATTHGELALSIPPAEAADRAGDAGDASPAPSAALLPAEDPA